MGYFVHGSGTGAGVHPRLPRCTAAPEEAWEAGSSWYLHLADPLSVASRDASKRVHLVSDTAVNDWVEALFERAWPLAAHAAREPMDS